MQEDKKILLEEQIKKIEEVLAVLKANFTAEAEEEIHALSVVKISLKELAEQG